MTLMPEKTDARIEKSRNALINTGLQMLMNKPDVSLSDIAAQAGVGRTTLYRQFNSRNQLIQAIAKQCLDEFDAATASLDTDAGSYTEAIELIFISVMPLADRLKFLSLFWGIAERDKSIIAMDKKYTQEMAELIEGAKQEGSIDTGLPTTWIVDLIDSLLSVAWKLVDVNNYAPDKAAKMMTKTLFDGIRPRKSLS